MDITDFALTVTSGPNHLVVAVNGELDDYTAPALRDRVRKELEGRAGVELTLDLSNMTFVDSTGLGVLVGIRRRVRETGGTLALSGLTPATTKVLEITGLSRVFDLEEPASS